LGGKSNNFMPNKEEALQYIKTIARQKLLPKKKLTQRTKPA